MEAQGWRGGRPRRAREAAAGAEALRREREGRFEVSPRAAREPAPVAARHGAQRAHPVLAEGRVGEADKPLGLQPVGQGGLGAARREEGVLGTLDGRATQSDEHVVKVAALRACRLVGGAALTTHKPHAGDDEIANRVKFAAHPLGLLLFSLLLPWDLHALPEHSGARRLVDNFAHLLKTCLPLFWRLILSGRKFALRRLLWLFWNGGWRKVDLAVRRPLLDAHFSCVVGWRPPLAEGMGQVRVGAGASGVRVFTHTPSQVWFE